MWNLLVALFDMAWEKGMKTSSKTDMRFSKFIDEMDCYMWEHFHIYSCHIFESLPRVLVVLACSNLPLFPLLFQISFSSVFSIDAGGLCCIFIWLEVGRRSDKWLSLISAWVRAVFDFMLFPSCLLSILWHAHDHYSKGTHCASIYLYKHLLLISIHHRRKKIDM